MEHIGTFLNKRSSLSKREVEIGILVIAHHWDADYVRQAHIREGKAAGLTQETIDAVLGGRDPKLADAHERAVYEFSRAMAGAVEADRCRVRQVEAVLGQAGHRRSARRCSATTPRWRSP